MTNPAFNAVDYATHVVKRNPWIITTESWFAKNKFIVLPLNPESVSFNIPLRVAHETTQAAKFVYVWRRRTTKSLMHSFQVDFNISSGNIIPAFDISTPDKLRYAQTWTGAAGTQPIPPVEAAAADVTKGISYLQQSPRPGVSVSGLYDKHVPIGVQNLYAMLALVEELNSYSGREATAENRVIVGMSTLAFPQLLLYGTITPEGLNFSMSAENPAEFTMNFSMKVLRTTPGLGYNSWPELVRTYKSQMFSQEQTLQWMRAFQAGSATTTGGGSGYGQPQDAGAAFEGSGISLA